MTKPLGPYPTLESVGLEILMGIVTKMLAIADANGWPIEKPLVYTDEERDVLARLRYAISALNDGDESG